MGMFFLAPDPTLQGNFIGMAGDFLTITCKYVDSFPAGNRTIFRLGGIIIADYNKVSQTAK